MDAALKTVKIVITVLNTAESYMTGGNTVNSEDSDNCTEHSRTYMHGHMYFCTHDGYHTSLIVPLIMAI